MEAAESAIVESKIHTCPAILRPSSEFLGVVVMLVVSGGGGSGGGGFLGSEAGVVDEMSDTD